MKTIKRYTPNIELKMIQVVPNGDWLFIKDFLGLIDEKGFNQRCIRKLETIASILQI